MNLEVLRFDTQNDSDFIRFELDTNYTSLVAQAITDEEATYALIDIAAWAQK